MSANLCPSAATEEEKPSGGGGALEGMDPVTGDYIRPQQQQQQKNAFVDCFTIEVPMPPGDAPHSEKGATDAGSSERRELQRKWSRRIVHTLSNRSRDADDEANNCLFGHQIRFTIMAICTLCLSSILSNILTFNFTYICMAGEKPANFSNMTDPSEWVGFGYNPNLDYSSAARSALFMVVAVGSLLTVFPLTILLNQFGSRLVFGCLGFVSALATLLVPLAANLGFPFMLLMRLVQGAAFSACLPVMGSITSHWSTIKQNGIFIAILSSFFQIAPIFTMPISGELCTSSLGWPSVYYLHGIVTIILFTIFMLYHRNSPNKHPMMGKTEIMKVMFNKGASIYSGPSTDGKRPPKKKKSRKVPYWAMYSDKSIWAILVASFGNFMGTQLSLQFMPTYINKVLHMPIEQTGMASAISPAIMFFIKLLAGQSSDRIQFISDGRKLRIYNTLSLGMMGLLFIVLALLNPTKTPALCLVILIASTCILGFNSGGFFKSSQMVSRQHSHFTLANISFLNCVCMLLVPLLNEIIAPENEPENWAIVLWIHGIILLLTNAFFCAFASAKSAEWTKDNFKDTKKGWKRNKIAVKNGNCTETPKTCKCSLGWARQTLIDRIGTDLTRVVAVLPSAAPRISNPSARPSHTHSPRSLFGHSFSHSFPGRKGTDPASSSSSASSPHFIDGQRKT
ncbi:hypothetical protein niasHS_005791 [Heterodera schachtii]|uniref:Major facilitator superfamily (MFS) profile domain-containing protein n=1 Tax=Heterodera schachtii TaxID=97005 RepID=A0ABD2JZF7_HETSC